MKNLGPHPLKRQSSRIQRQKGEKKELAWSLSSTDSSAEDAPGDKAHSRRFQHTAGPGFTAMVTQAHLPVLRIFGKVCVTALCHVSQALAAPSVP